MRLFRRRPSSTCTAGTYSVEQAICRQLTHYAYHVGQMLFLAKHLAEVAFLNIPPEGSREFNESPHPYRTP